MQTFDPAYYHVLVPMKPDRLYTLSVYNNLDASIEWKYFQRLSSRRRHRSERTQKTSTIKKDHQSIWNDPFLKEALEWVKNMADTDSNWMAIINVSSDLFLFHLFSLHFS